VSEHRDDPGTPLDHPFLVPALLLAGCLWFGYDGWWNDDPEMLEHVTFNRVGAAVLAAAALWTGLRGWREWSRDRRGPERDADRT
jgi:hypothetical protein